MAPLSLHMSNATLLEILCTGSYNNYTLSYCNIYLHLKLCLSLICRIKASGGVTKCLYRGSYMSAHVLLNLLNELGKREKMRGLPSILSLFCNEFNKFNNTRARMLDSIYHMTNSLKSHFWRKML